ncbi:hypothetical protein [Marinagarivorans cellulosilyticus]|uniref:DUF2946 domain-containing protein n=1 Tax=Marinagarivorans cellulosilyticus TaxID=2721545 RepID=A0AAN1WJG9_9GAMM|nr:hypothetical protein [Marinagarivorans cellulosilyticus]BCD98690.1 hypothetical protein MARGE09_P2891 [Marinagarivorans cellulosilyticus]
MTSKRFKAIVLVWVLLSQPLLSLAFACSPANDSHDHSSHDHASIENNLGQMVQEKHHSIDTHETSAHDHHAATKVMSTHDCSPCLNGDMSHCQCHAVTHMGLGVMLKSFSVFEPTAHYTYVLAAHDQSLIRPPIFA